MNWATPRVAVLAALGALAVACDRPAAAGSAPEWTPADHRSADDDKAQAVGAQVAPGAATPGGDSTQLVEVAWRQQCTACHGASGKGDGQMGPMLQAPDLSREDFQTKATDAEIAAVIKTGRNKMPRFDLPDSVVKGLVARIRSLRGHK